MVSTAERKVWIRNCELSKAADYIMNIEGNGMWPLFKAEDKVFIQKTDTLEPGEIGVFMDGEKPFMRQYYPDGLRVFRPDLSNFTPDEKKTYPVCGRVLGVVAPDMLPTEHEIEILESD